MFTAFLATGARRLRRRRAAMVLTMFMALGFAGVVNAQRPVVSTGVIPLAGVFQNVQLEGFVHVVVWVPPNPIFPTTIHANLPTMDVVATDLAFGRSYLAHGAGKASPVCAPVDPCNTAIEGFSLQRIPQFDSEVPGGDSCAPTDPCEPIAFALSLDFVINGDGTLNFDQSNASVAECGVDVCPGG
jgi:hypothetical protein